MADFKTIQESVHKLAVEKGWHDGDTTVVEKIMLVVTELAEAVECVRNDEPAIFQLGKAPSPIVGENKIIKVFPASEAWDDKVKPEGVLVELADAVIRVMDLAQSQGWDLENAIRLKHKYNTTRTYRHGGKTL